MKKVIATIVTIIILPLEAVCLIFTIIGLAIIAARLKLAFWAGIKNKEEVNSFFGQVSYSEGSIKNQDNEMIEVDEEDQCLDLFLDAADTSLCLDDEWLIIGDEDDKPLMTPEEEGSMISSQKTARSSDIFFIKNSCKSDK